MTDTLRKIVQPYAARLISSNTLLQYKRQLQEIKRKLLVQQHHIDIYLRINDPYSYLLVQVLAKFEQRFDVQMEFNIILNLQQEMYPEEDMWHDNGFLDAAHLADLYQLQWSKEKPEKSPMREEQGTRLLLQLEAKSKKDKVCDWAAVEEVFHQYWFQHPFNNLVKAGQADNVWLRQLAKNEQTLVEQGHYMSAMLYYAGEWYWGLDRLDHLEKRLIELGQGNDSTLVFDKTYGDFCKTAELYAPRLNHKPLILYFSIRSPYSHLALEQAIKLAQHYKLTLNVKPVLPMVMRGLSVPNTKKMYIFHDTKREAEKLGIDYGFVADPLGEGVNRCYSLFNYACALGKETEYLLSYARAVNAEGIRSETDAGLKFIIERSGLNWNHAKQLLQQDGCNKEWQIWAEENRQQMISLGSWGVPTFQYGNAVLWGQDRAGLIERMILRDLA